MSDIQLIEQAEVINRIQEAMKELDVDLLQEALTDMKEQHSLRDAGMVLNPSPMTHIEQQELNAAKIKQFELYINAAMNLQEIKELQIKLEAVKQNIK